MDFHQLMKQASANQFSVQRKHKLEKRQKEEMKKTEEAERREQVRKASALLQDMKKTSEKEEMAYRGITTSRAAEFEKARSSLTTSVTGNHHPDGATPTIGRPHPIATPSSKTRPVNKLSEASKPVKGKVKLTENCNPPPAQKTPAITSTSKPSKSLTTSKPSGTAAASTSRVQTTSSGTPVKHDKPPVNFQDLIKLAQEKAVVQGSSNSGGGKTDASIPPCQRGLGGGGVVPESRGAQVNRSTSNMGAGRGRTRERSPLGKQLLERGSKARKMANGGRERVAKSGKSGRSSSEPRDCTGISRGTHETVMDRSSVGNNLRELAQSRVVGRGSKGRRLNETDKDRLSVSSGGKSASGCGRGGGKNGEEGTKVPQRLPESALLMRERFRRELEASSNGNRPPSKTTSVKSNSFYGSAHAQLSREGRPKFPSKRPASCGPYQSSWVSEMSEYVERLREGEEGEEGYSEEEEDGLDDFVVDDDEGDDVSSAIREIFGYDKRRYRDDHEDDRMMESSFAQQQYEEMRSSRIGRQEDAEDLRRETERLVRKRKKGHSPPLRQTKLSFR